MFVYLVNISLLFLIVFSHQEKVISYAPYKGLICREDNNNFEKYIFDENTGYLYFYQPNRDIFIPLNLRKESNFFSEDIPEIFSIIKNNKLLITEIEYSNKFKDGYFKIKHKINLNTLIKKSLYKNKKNQLVSEKVSCYWIDPKSDIKIE